MSKTSQSNQPDNTPVRQDVHRSLVLTKREDPAENYPKLIGLHYHAVRKIGEGSFGVIYEGYSDLNGRRVAIKFESRKTSTPQLRDEFRHYKTLCGLDGIPMTYYYGQEGSFNCLVLDLLGPSLEELFDLCGRKFKSETVCRIAIQLITRIQCIHQRGLIYRDIKPDNFLIEEDGRGVSVVDFGMAKQYVDVRTNQHIPYREKKALSGTARYMSINTHLGKEQSRRDDLEALGHVFFYFLRGSLPWQGMKAATNREKYDRIGQKKQSTPISELCADLPGEFGTFLGYARGLEFEQEPDYEYCRQLFSGLLEREGLPATGPFEWAEAISKAGDPRASLHYESPNMTLPTHLPVPKRIEKDGPPIPQQEEEQGVANWFRRVFCFCL